MQISDFYHTLIQSNEKQFTYPNMPQRQPSKPKSSRPPTVRHGSSRFIEAMPQRSNSSRTLKSNRTPSVRTNNTVNNAHSANTTTMPSQRPINGMRRQNTLQTRYMEMLLDLDKVPRLHNILAAFFGWLLLAGFVVFPGTFTSVQEELAEDPDSTASTAAARAGLLGQVSNLPLLIVAAVACGLGAVGLVALAVRWRRNYVWLLNRIFLPSATNALAGLISTFITVYTTKDGAWSIMAKVTGAVEAGDLVVSGVLFVVTTVMLRLVKRKHEKEVQRLEKDDEADGFLDKVGKKLNQPAVEPQSVV